MLQPERILVRAPNWLGDHVMARAFYEALKDCFPKSQRILFCPEGLEGLFPSDLFQEEWVFSKKHLKTRPGVKDWIERIKVHHFNLSFCLTSSWSSAFLFYRAGIQRRIGFSESGSGILLSDSLPWRGKREGRHKSEIYQDLLRREFPEKSSPASTPFLKEAHGERENYWVLAPGAALPLREWPYFLELLLEIKKKYPAKRILVVGTALESAWVSRLKRWNLEGVEDFIGKTELPQLKALCSKAQLVIANDSGVAHLAASLSQALTIVLMGPGTPHYIAPLGPQVLCLTPGAKVSCAPCEKPYCKSPFGYQKCLKEIPVNTVLNKIEEALLKFTKGDSHA